jgi:hypothetical protein
MRIDDVNLDDIVIAKRFGIDQGEKVRSVDDESRAYVNWATGVSEKLKYDGIDLLLKIAAWYQSVLGRLPSLLKADIDSAFRRIAINPDHR